MLGIECRLGVAAIVAAGERGPFFDVGEVVVEDDEDDMMMTDVHNEN